MVLQRRPRSVRTGGAERSAAGRPPSGSAEPSRGGEAGPRGGGDESYARDTKDTPDRFGGARRETGETGESGENGENGENDDAFVAEALSYIDSLYGTAMRLTRRAADAEDLVQDTYLKAFRAANQFERGTNLKAWLFTILHNTFRNMRRSDGRNPVDVNSETVEHAVDLHGEDRSPEQLLARATLDTDLQEALDSLPDAFRQAVWLRDVEEFTYAEIASMLDVPIGTVMSRISRGRRMLYDRLLQKKKVASS